MVFHLLSSSVYLHVLSIPLSWPAFIPWVSGQVMARSQIIGVYLKVTRLISQGAYARMARSTGMVVSVSMARLLLEGVY